MTCPASAGRVTTSTHPAPHPRCRATLGPLAARAVTPARPAAVALSHRPSRALPSITPKGLPADAVR